MHTPGRLFLAASLCLLALCAGARAQTQPPAPQAPAALRNADVVDMVKAGLSAEVVAAKINGSKREFDTSPAALRELKEAGVPDAVLLAMVQASPAAPPEPESPAGGSKALVYVFRHKNFSTRNMQPSVYVDGVEVARIDDGKFFVVQLDPGKHTVEVNKGHTGAEIDMKAGEKYYFRVEIIPGFWKGRSKVDYIQKEQGAVELKKMKPLEAKWIKDNSKVTTQSAEN